MSLEHMIWDSLQARDTFIALPSTKLSWKSLKTDLAHIEYFENII